VKSALFVAVLPRSKPRIRAFACVALLILAGMNPLLQRVGYYAESTATLNRISDVLSNP
jgi:hypothetical protein